uniref:Tonsoku-like protein n=1 Tax=Timema bartmani TaxID=61472 RepID=A0A7R9ER33_9NEOP|nr:unnamed protein product [Timema bartmani]
MSLSVVVLYAATYRCIVEQDEPLVKTKGSDAKRCTVTNMFAGKISTQPCSFMKSGIRKGIFILRVPALAGRERGKSFRNLLSTPDRDSNLDLPVISILVYCKSGALDHESTKAESFALEKQQMWSVLVHLKVQMLKRIQRLGKLTQSPSTHHQRGHVEGQRRLHLYRGNTNYTKLSRRKQRALEEVNLELLATTCKKLAEHYNVCGRYEEALQEYKEEESAWDALNKPLHVAVANRMIGEVYSNMGEFTKAIVHQKKHLEIARAENSLIEQQRALATIGRTYFCMAESMDTENAEYEACLDQAKKAYLKSLKVCERLTGIGKQEMVEMRARLLLNFGLVLECQKDIEKAIEFIQKSIGLCKSHDLFEDLYRCYSSLAMVFYRQKDTSRALCLLNKALETARRLEDKALHSCETLASKAEVFFSMADFRGAKQALYKAYKLHTPNKPERHSIENNLKIAVALCQAEDKLLTLTENDFVIKKKIYETLGDGCVAVKNFDKAIEYYHKMLEGLLRKYFGGNPARICVEGEWETTISGPNWDLNPNLPIISRPPKHKGDVLNRSATEVDESLVKLHAYGIACKTTLNIAEVLELQGASYEELFDLYKSAQQLVTKAGDLKLEVLVLSALISMQKLMKPEIVGESTDENEELVRPRMARKRSRFSNKRNEKGETPLHTACISGKLIAVKTLLEEGHSVNVRDHCGWLPIHEASNHGFKDIVELLLDKGASINDRGGAGCEGITPLHDAAACGHLAVMELLLDRGASAVALTDKGETPLDCLLNWYERAGSSLEPFDQIFYQTMEARLRKALQKAGHKAERVIKISNKSKIKPNLTKPSSNKQLTSKSVDCFTYSIKSSQHLIENSSNCRSIGSRKPFHPLNLRRTMAGKNSSDSEDDSYVNRWCNISQRNEEKSENEVDEQFQSSFDISSSPTGMQIDHKDISSQGKNETEKSLHNSSRSIENINAKDEYVKVITGLRNRKLESEEIQTLRPSAEESHDRLAFLSEGEVGDDWLEDDLGSTDRPNKRRKQNISTHKSLDLVQTSNMYSTPTREYNKSEDDLPADSLIIDNISLSSEILDYAHPTGMNSGNQTPVQNSLLESHSDSDRQPYIDPSTRVSKHHKMAVTTPLTTSGLRAIKVRVEDMLFLVTVKEPDTQTIGSLAKEAAERCFIKKDMIPKLVLLTRDGAMLSNDDTLALIINEEEIHSSVLSWDTPLISERYKRFCKISQLDEDKRVTSRLDDTQRTQRLSLKNLFLSYEHLVPIFRSLKLQNSLLDLNLAGVLLQDEGVKPKSKKSDRIKQLVKNFSAAVKKWRADAKGSAGAKAPAGIGLGIPGLEQQMWLVCWAVLIAFAETSPRQLPFWGSQSFLRDSVERIPAHDTSLAEELHRSSNIREYITIAIGPNTALTSSERLPLRDAVEKRPDWDLPEVNLGYSASHLAPVVEKPGLAWWKQKMASQPHSIKSTPSHYYGNKFVGE